MQSAGMVQEGARGAAKPLWKTSLARSKPRAASAQQQRRPARNCEPAAAAEQQHPRAVSCRAGAAASEASAAAGSNQGTSPEVQAVLFDMVRQRVERWEGAAPAAIRACPASPARTLHETAGRMPPVTLQLGSRPNFTNAPLRSCTGRRPLQQRGGVAAVSWECGAGVGRRDRE